MCTVAACIARIPHTLEVLVKDLQDRLEQWTAQGLISTDQAEQIAAHEAQAPSARITRTTGAEAIGYVGAALTIGALVLLFGQLWMDLLVVGRLVLVGTLTSALLAAGFALRRAASPAMQRLSSVLLTAGVAGTGWFAGVVARDLANITGARVGVTVGAVTLIVSLVLYVLHHRALLQLAVLVSLLTLLMSAAELSPLPISSTWRGVLVGAVGLVWTLLARGGWHRPRLVADIIGAALLLIGAQIASIDQGRVSALIVGVVIAAVLVAAAVLLDELHLLVVGALGLFALVPQLVFEIFGDVIGAPATLLLIGLLLVLLAVGLGRARREVVAAPRSKQGGEPA